MTRLVILIVALAAGGGAAWLAYSALTTEDAGAPVAEAPESIATQSVMVAATQIARGEKLGPANLEWQEWPQSIIGEGFVLRENDPQAIETYTGWTARATFLPGEPVRLDRLAEGHGGLMSVILSPGMRAVAIPVSAETGAGGFVLPEDRVDIVHTTMQDADNDGNDEPVSRTIIRNVRVLGVDQMANANEDGSAVVAKTATLELTPEQVEALSTAQNSGRLSLALRSVADLDELQVEDFAHLKPQPGPDDRPEPTVATPAAPAAPVEQDQAPPRPHSIRIIGSGKVETLEVGRGEG